MRGGPWGSLLLSGCVVATPPVDPGMETDADPEPIVVVTFNTGTTEGLVSDDDTPYGTAQAMASDRWYGDGLAWEQAVQAAQDWLEGASADVVALQEVFHPEACVDVPEEARDGFVCGSWAPGDPTVAQRILGEGWQVVCHPGKPDKCVGVRESFGVFEGCDAALCMEGLAGSRVPDCGSGARVAHGTIRLADGGELEVVSVHGSSGLSADDRACRIAQVEQVFVDAGDGAPAARGARNLVLGDLNTDPGRAADLDASAARWLDFVGDGQAMQFITDVGPDAAPTYGGVVNIDHVMSDALHGTCTHPTVFTPAYFDHVPARCEVAWR